MNEGGSARDEDSAAATEMGDEVRLGDGHDPPVQGERFPSTLLYPVSLLFGC